MIGALFKTDPRPRKMKERYATSVPPKNLHRCKSFLMGYASIHVCNVNCSGSPKVARNGQFLIGGTQHDMCWIWFYERYCHLVPKQNQAWNSQIANACIYISTLSAIIQSNVTVSLRRFKIRTCRYCNIINCCSFAFYLPERGDHRGPSRQGKCRPWQ